jgi:hypothetical protein
MNRIEDTTIEAVLEHLIADGAGGIGPPSTRRSRRMKRMASSPSGAVSPCAAGKLKLPVGGGAARAFLQAAPGSATASVQEMVQPSS